MAPAMFAAPLELERLVTIMRCALGQLFHVEQFGLTKLIAKFE
jgi:hypothetical protein